MIAHVLCHEVRAGGQQAVCLIPSTHTFLLVSAYIESYKSGFYRECRRKSLKGSVSSSVPSMPRHDKRPLSKALDPLIHFLRVSSSDSCHPFSLTAPPWMNHPDTKQLWGCAAAKVGPSMAASLGKHFVWIGGPSRCVKDSNHSMDDEKIQRSNITSVWSQRCPNRVPEMKSAFFPQGGLETKIDSFLS